MLDTPIMTFFFAIIAASYCAAIFDLRQVRLAILIDFAKILCIRF